ncbi:hypothetical protein GVAV_003110 [Gurleya vavrai]
MLNIRKDLQHIKNPEFDLLYNGELYNNSESDTYYLNEILNDFVISNKICNCNFKVFNLIHNSDFFEFFTEKEDIGKPNFNCFCIINDLFKKLKSENEAAYIIRYKNNVYFFKDDIGRKSLGYTISLKDPTYNNKNDIPEIEITVSSCNFTTEIYPKCIYKFDLNTNFLCRISKSELLIKNIKTIELEFKNFHIDSIYNALKIATEKRLHEYNNVVLFSGGVDSLLITILLHKAIPKNKPIYLINTMFEHKKISKDRRTGYQSFFELQKNYPERKFIFIENNISIKDFKMHADHIKKLIFPKKLMMDFNIGACLFFGAKKASEYSKVLFNGCGADELFCGYSNHKDIENVQIRIKNDINNIWDRNLGRDDRVISDNNIEPRYIFLDTDVIKNVLELPREYLILNDNGNFVNKVVLRKILEREGFTDGCKIKKTAMQFGSGVYAYEDLKL